MEKQATYKLKLSGGGLDLERDVSPELAHSIVRLVFDGVVPAVRVLTPPPNFPPIPDGTNKPALSIREFMETHNAKKIPEQISSIALFLKTHQNATVFTRKELIKNFEDAQEPVPKNLSRDIAWVTKIGWIAPKAGARRTFYLTGTGETAVKAKFSEQLKKKRTRDSRKSRKTRKAAPAGKP